MNIFAGSIEIQMLCWSVVLGLAQLILATAFETKDQGRAWNISPRDGTPPSVSAVTGRLKRAFNNFRETFGLFAVAVLAVAFLEKTNAASALGCADLFLGAADVCAGLCRRHHRPAHRDLGGVDDRSGDGAAGGVGVIPTLRRAQGEDFLMLSLPSLSRGEA